MWCPHWAAWAHNGYGEARFIFYPPISWSLGGLLGLVLPWKLVPGAYIWIVLTVSGCSMFVLARRWLPRADAIFAAVIYTANPYHLVIIYWRSAVAELLAAAYLPLLLLMILRSEDEGQRIVVPLSLLMALGWLTNIPSAVMMNYSLALLVLCVAIARRSFSVIGYAALAACLGAALASFYLLPVVHQRSWVHLGQVLAPGVRPQESFLFAVTKDVDHNRFNLLVSVVAVWQIALLGGALYVSRRLRRQRLWLLTSAWSVFCILLMMRFTLPLWMHLPELRFVQFPWRWLLCLNVSFVLAIVLSLRRWWLRGLVYAVAVGGVLLVWHSVQPPWWDNAADIQEMLDKQHDGIGYEGTDEYVPVTADADEVDDKAPQVRFVGKGGAEIQIMSWQAESRMVTAKAGTPGKLVLRLFNYPLWKVHVNGRDVTTENDDPTGQMMIPIPAGESNIQIRFVDSWDRMVGVIVSVLASVAAFWFAIKRRAVRPVVA